MSKKIGMVKQKPTRNQSLAVIGILVLVMVGGIALIVFVSNLIFGRPDSSSVEYKITFVVGFMIIVGGVFLVVMIIEDHWNIKLT